MSNIIETNNQVNIFNQSQVDLIKNTVAKGATGDELQMFLYLAQQYQLDPFKKEIWFLKYNGQTNIMTSRDGYLKYAQLNDDFEGLMSFVVKEGDVFEIDASEYKVTHKFGAKRGHILGAWARCDRKGKKPFIAYVEFSEYNKSTNIWKSYPSAMIQKVAEVFVLKRAFGINGLVTKEEIDAGETTIEQDVITDHQPVTEDKQQPKKTISQPQQKRMFALSKGNPDLVRQAIQEKGFAATSEVTKDLYNEICSRIEQLVTEFENDVIPEPEDQEDVPFDDIDNGRLPWDEEE